jgi:hypothetical protein
LGTIYAHRELKLVVEKLKLVVEKLKAYTLISKKKSHGLTRLKASRDMSHDPGFDWPWFAERVRRARRGRGRGRARASA